MPWYLVHYCIASVPHAPSIIFMSLNHSFVLCKDRGGIEDTCLGDSKSKSNSSDGGVPKQYTQIAHASLQTTLVYLEILPDSSVSWAG